jgi:hypothetical protein
MHLRTHQTGDTTMSSRTSLALITALILATSSAAMASTHHAAHHRSAPEQFETRGVALPTEPAPSANEENWMDRASQSFSGGGY